MQYKSADINWSKEKRFLIGDKKMIFLQYIFYKSIQKYT